jgi:hypothetical protein
MGNSSSSNTNQTITNNTINKNTLNMLNQTIMNTAVNTMVSTANQCSTSVNATNNCSANLGSVNGGLNINANQSNKASVDFSCLAQTESVGGINSAMTNSLAAELKALNGTTAAAQLNSLAKSSNKSGAGAFGSSSSATSNSTVNNNVTNETVQNISNIFQNNITNNFTQKTLNECVSTTNLVNNVNPQAAVVNGGANITCIQSNTLEQVQKCEFLSAAINKTTNAVASELGLSVVSSSETQNKTEATNVAKSENVATGPIQDFFNGISNVLQSIPGFASCSSFGPILGPICCICCILIICLCCLIIFTTIGGHSGNTGNSGNTSNSGTGQSGFSGNLSDYGLGSSSDMESLLSNATKGFDNIGKNIQSKLMNSKAFNKGLSNASNLFKKLSKK